MAIKWDKFTVKSQQALQAAQGLAAENGNPEVLPLHLMAALLEDKEGVVLPVLEKVGVPVQQLLSTVHAAIEKLPKVQGEGAQPGIGQALTKALDGAFKEAETFKDDYVSTEHLLLSLARQRPSLSQAEPVQLALVAQGATHDAILKALQAVRGSQRVTDQNPEGRFQALEKYAKDLTEQARRGKLDPVIGRDEEIRRVIQVLSRRTKNNPVLIGEPGVGKTAIVEGLARRIFQGDVPEILRDKRVVSLDLGSMLAGAKFRGEFEERLKAVLKEIDESNGQIVLFIDELHTLVGAGAAEGAIDASNMLKPALARGELRAIGATTLNEYRKYIEKDAALERRFQIVYVGEPNVEDTIAILRGLRERYETHHKVRIKDSAIVAAAELSHRYISDRFLPDKAIDLVDEAAAALAIQIGSVPVEIDDLERRAISLEIERNALTREKDANSQERLQAVERELAEAREQASGLRARWQKERGAIGEIAALKETLERLRFEAQEATRKGDLQRAAELQYGEIPKAERALTELTRVQDEFVASNPTHDDKAVMNGAPGRVAPDSVAGSGEAGPSASPQDDKDKEVGPLATPQDDKDKEAGPSAMPQDDKDKEVGPLATPQDDKDKEVGPLASPQDDKDKEVGPLASPQDDKDKEVGPLASPQDDKDKEVGPLASPQDDKDKEVGPLATPQDDKDKEAGPSAMPQDDKDKEVGPLASPQDDKDKKVGALAMPQDDHVQKGVKGKKGTPSRMLREEVDEEDIARIVSKWTGIPISKMLEGEVQKLTQMEQRLRERVVGQDEALTVVANAIRRARAGLSDPKRPIGSFIFLGPTGVGKTETARALAEFLFDDEQAMVRIDMSEYMEKHAVSRLIGAPPGYVGFDEGGQLTESIRRRPYAVVLFDEIEKAHPDVFNVLLQVLDDGRLTDSKGRTVDFKNTVLIMTSNIGASNLTSAWADGEEGFEDAKARVTESLKQHFRPEFLNRVDDIVVFHPLGESQLTHIVDLRLKDLQAMLAERKIVLKPTDGVRAAIFKSGYDRAYGARPLKRAIQRMVQDPLAMKILDGSVLHGDTVRIEAGRSGALEFVVERRSTE